MLTDTQLIQKIREGDNYALKSLVIRHQDHIYTVCYSILKLKGEAQEAAQDTFIKAFKSINLYKEEAKFSTWLYRIAYRTCLYMLRKRKTSVNLDTVTNIVAIHQGDVMMDIEKRESQELLLSAINQLDPKEAGLIRMYYLDQLSIKELNASTGLSISNTKVILHRARKKLASIIKSQYSELIIPIT